MLWSSRKLFQVRLKPGCWAAMEPSKSLCEQMSLTLREDLAINQNAFFYSLTQQLPQNSSVNKCVGISPHWQPVSSAATTQCPRVLLSSDTVICR